MRAGTSPTASPTSLSSERSPRAFLGGRRLAIIIFSVAFLVRLVYLAVYTSSPFFEVHIADALYHEEWARRILGGDIFSLKMHGVLYKAPLYPYFVAFGYWLSGNSNFFLMLLQVLMAAGSCLLIFLIGRRYFGVPAGLVGALVYNFYFPSVYFSTEMEVPTLAIFLTLLSFYLLHASEKALAWVASAVTLGLSLLALPTNALLFPLYVFILHKRQGAPKLRARRAAIFAVVVCATILPCTLRNLIAGGRLTLISANGGINFYLGNNERYDETVHLQPGYAFEELYDEPRRVAGVDSVADRDRYWYRKAFAFIAAHPGQEILLVAKKLALYFANYETYRNTDVYYAKATSIYRNVPFVPASLILATGLVGLVLAIRKPTFAFVPGGGQATSELVAFCVLLALPCLIFFVTDRYRLPSMSVWAMFSGFFVVWVARALGKRIWSAGTAALAGAAVVAVVSNLNLFVKRNPEYRPHLNLGFIYETQAKYDRAVAEYATALRLLGKAKPRDPKTESELHARIGNVHMTANDLAEARASLDRAVAINPRSGPAYSYLGTLFDKEGKSDLAVEMFGRALELNPWDVVSVHNLGLLYLNHKQLDQAMAKFHRVLELAPEHAGAHNNLAYIYGTQGRYDLMEAEAKQAIYYHPGGAQARYNLASLYLGTGRVDEAIGQYRAIIEAAPRDSGNAHNQLGVIHAERGDLKQAALHWRKALEVDPSNEDALANLRRAEAMMR